MMIIILIYPALYTDGLYVLYTKPNEYKRTACWGEQKLKDTQKDKKKLQCPMRVAHMNLSEFLRSS